MQIQKWLPFLVMGLVFTGFGAGAQAGPAQDDYFYSQTAKKRIVEFDAFYKIESDSAQRIRGLGADDKQKIIDSKIVPLLRYLFGPLSYRNIGSPLEMLSLNVNWDEVRDFNGAALVPYSYRGSWIVENSYSAKNKFTIPLPVNETGLYVENWSYCTDRSVAKHRVWGLLWYFWDPTRSTYCPHREDHDYQNIEVRELDTTTMPTTTYPDYQKLIKNGLQMTLAFGYRLGRENPDPENDFDEGMDEYRYFLSSYLEPLLVGFRVEKILQKEYPGAPNPELVIGRRFTGRVGSVDVTINVVTNAGVEQMNLFAKSFAHDHDGLFAWLGHSQVGGGFDAEKFKALVKSDPKYYQMTDAYQILYWGGCNGDSYYTTPFFKMKAEASNGQDPTGTLGLNILANGLPSRFELNALNAEAFVDQFLHWNDKRSFQALAKRIEAAAENDHAKILFTVLGHISTKPDQP